ncbi:hypothetical protein N7U49_43130 [Streptomyces sp. AD2-2]|nr:hypothetical protein N7U49_43130 [Streptomyces sp. AD2-2]
MTDDVLLTGLRGAVGQIMEGPHQLRDAHEAVVGADGGPLLGTDGRPALDVPEHLPPALVRSEKPGCARPAPPLELPEQSGHIARPFRRHRSTPYGLPDPDDLVDRASAQRRFLHVGHLPYWSARTSTASHAARTGR